MRRHTCFALSMTLVVLGCGSTDQDTGGSAGGSTAREGDPALSRAAAEKAIASGAGGRFDFGAAMQGGAPVSVSALTEDPAAYAGSVVRVEGTVSTVCKAMGCWVELAGPSGAKIMASSAEHDVLVPRNSEGVSIVVEGLFTATPPDDPAGEPTYSLSLDAATIATHDTHDTHDAS